MEVDRQGSPRMTLTSLPAPVAPLALTTDELRAIARCIGAPLTSLLLDDEEEADAPVADAVALRSLAARGLVSIAGDPTQAGAVGLTVSARQLLGPVLSPEALVEIEIDRVGLPFVERHVVCAAGPRTLVLSEADEADVWRVLEGTTELGSTLAAVVRLPEVAGDGGAGSGRRLIVPAAAHQAADEALDEGGDAVAVLVAAGADRETASAWISAVEARTISVELRAARLLPGDVVDAAELRILSAGPLGTWLLDLDEADGESDGEAAAGDDGGWAATTSVVTEVGSCSAATALDGLLSAHPIPTAG